MRSWPRLDPLAPHALAAAQAADEAGIAEPTARRLNKLGRLFKRKARHREAEPLYRRALAIDEASYGPDHPHVAIRLNNLADCCSARTGPARPSRSIAARWRLTRRATGRIIPRWPRPQQSRHFAGLRRIGSGEAEPLYRRGPSDLRRSLRAGPPDVASASTISQIAVRHETALLRPSRLIRRALADLRKGTSVPIDPDVAEHVKNLAGIALRLELSRRERVSQLPRRSGDRRGEPRAVRSERGDPPQQSRSRCRASRTGLPRSSSFVPLRAIYRRG